MTAQIGETLILDGEEVCMNCTPHLPIGDLRLVEIEEKDVVGHGICFSTACWRRYIGTWEIRDDRLYLNSIAGRFKLITDRPIFAEWFSGVIIIPQGKMLKYVHMWFGEIYEQHLYIKIENGQVVSKLTIDNRGGNSSSDSQSCESPLLKRRLWER